MKNLLFAAPLVLAACAGSFEYAPRKYPDRLRWNVSSVEVTFRDERPKTVAAPPPVPAVALPGNGEVADVTLPREFSAFVRYRLARLVTGSGEPIKLDIHVVKARVGWSAGAVSETESAEVELRFHVATRNGRLLVEGVGTGSHEFSSSDASDQELRDVFRAACSDALDNFLSHDVTYRALNASR